MAELSDTEILQELERRGKLTDQERDELTRLRAPVPAPIPDIQKPDLTPPQAPPATYPATEAGYEMAGGMAGGMLGAPLGPPGVVGGAAMGVLAGSLTHDAINRGLQTLGVISPDVKLRSTGEAMDDAVKDMEIDAAFAGGTAVLGVLARQGKHAIARWVASNEARQLSQKGAEVVRNVIPDGNPFLGVAEVTDSNILRSYKRVLGRFPFFAIPFKRSEARKATAVLDIKERLFHRLGPSVGVADLGVDVNSAAQKMWRGVKIYAGQKYEKFLRLAEERGAIVPTKHIQGWFADVNEEMVRKAVPLKGGAKADARSKTSFLSGFMDKYAKIADELDIHQYRGLMDDWDEAIAKSKDAKEGLGVKRLMEFKKQAEIDLSNISDVEVQHALKDADSYYARAMKTFETPTAKRFQRVDKTRFGVGFSESGTLNADELFNAVIKDPSPSRFQQLRSMLGSQDEYIKAVRGYLDNAWTASHTVSPRGDEIINIETFAKQLGLDNTRSVKFSALEDALKDTGLKFQELKDFVDVARVAFEDGTINVSQFVQRRAVLGGARSAIKALSPFAAAGGTFGGVVGGGAGVVSGAIAPVAAAYLAYRGGAALAKPRELKLLTTALDEAVKTNLRADAMVRLIRLVPEAFGDEEERKPDKTTEMESAP